MATIYLKDRKRWERYRRGWSDEQLARADNISVYGIRKWRHQRGLPVNSPPKLRPELREGNALVWAFISDLIRAADTLPRPPKAEQIGRYMKAWREEKAERRGSVNGY